MQPQELIQAAQARSAAIDVPRSPPALEAALERLRAEAAALYAKIPEPPLYRRSSEDPARKAAEGLLPEVERVLAQGLALVRVPEAQAQAMPHLEALEAHGAALCHTAAGRLEQAEVQWRRAQELERAAHKTRALLSRGGELPPVFDKSSGRSRFDPHTNPVVRVKLVCPNTGCKRIDEFGFSPLHPTHQFTCPHCRQPFVGFFGELTGLEVEEKRSSRRYLFTVKEVGSGGAARVDFEEASGQQFPAARNDLLVFLYTEKRELKAVVNLTTSRVMWMSPASSCFVATVAFGEGAPELVAFRAFRDDVLRKHAAGRLFIRGYYELGPGVAEWVRARPRVRGAVRWGLGRVHQGLKAREERRRDE
ncbi:MULTISPECIES: CFI-box-CTERM domain-containing protein [Myxococcaceae]|uniref:CFI-box-CTERM domain-containing protein n=1 Tax=Myxococcaceae TaxID=31 RepID=UPI001890960A|nr:MULTISPECIES: CFI-box-CTERM domain-containing protein [Myxococcaceae]MBF5044499.1 hypothetical protein [Simulacricoccus sp. 17bor-14]